jgi:hypothetical protein
VQCGRQGEETEEVVRSLSGEAGDVLQPGSTAEPHPNPAACFFFFFNDL